MYARMNLRRILGQNYTSTSTRAAFIPIFNPNKYSQRVRQYSISLNTPRNIIAPISVDELPEHTIEEMVASLSPLERAATKIIISGNMSFGSISLEAHKTIAEALNRIALAEHGVKTIDELNKLSGYLGPMSGSGEGGELPFRYGSLWQIQSPALQRVQVDLQIFHLLIADSW